jgi:outer membrane protein assembly factor BamA
MRPSLWMYYKTQKAEKGLSNWMNRKLGQKPVYASMADPEAVSKSIDAKLFNLGYFDAATTYEWTNDSLTASVKYFITLSKPYTIRAIEYNTGTDSLGQLIAATRNESLVKIGAQYSLDAIKSERFRIDDLMKEHGYYYFNYDFILYKMDTGVGNRGVRLRVEIKPETPTSTKQPYTISAVNVFADYELGKPNTAPKREIENVNYYSNLNYVRPAPIIQSVFFQNNKLYNRKDHNQTLSRLNNLGIYKFVNVRIDKVDTATSSHFLRANILLTPIQRRSLSTELQAVSKSNGFLGPGLTFSYRDRNVFGGAELFIANLKGSFESQLNGQYKGQFSYEINPTLELYIPRFILPFTLRTNSLYVPRTKFTLDLSYLSRVNYYDINSIKFTFGYKWKQSLPVDHDLSVISLNYFNIFNQSADFNALVNDNPTLALRYEKQFIAGMSYSYTFNQQVVPQKKNPNYMHFNIDVAGNALSAFNNLTGDPPTQENPNEIFGVRYAQYLKADVDLRKLFRLDKEGRTFVATRLFAGWAYPYGNASTIPYIKQYFSGGPYSLRGFPIYSVGPGTYQAPDSLQELYFVQQGGEIKLEGNIEYRFTISGMVKGAFFADAGNTWLNNENPDIPGGKFSPETFMNEIAVNIGTGIRFDVQFFVFRLDLGIPVRKPWLPDGERWVFNQFDLGNTTWRRNNLIFNLAFGYPF